MFDSSGNLINTIGSGLSYAQDVAVDPSTGYIYVADSGNNRVVELDSSGNLIATIGVGILGFPTGVAVGPSGNIFVTDNNNHRVALFDSLGSYISQFAVGTNINHSVAFDSSGNVYVSNDSNNSIDVYGLASVRSGGITGNGFSFDLLNSTVLGSITSAGATISIDNSTVSTVDVSGANETGDGQAGGTINLTNTAAGALIANGGNSTDHGYGGAAGTFNVDDSSSYTSETANAGSNGPNLGSGQQHGGGSTGGSSSIAGCTDPGASNYNSSATTDNGHAVIIQHQKCVVVRTLALLTTIQTQL